jgi:hypothetical protein
MQFQAARGARNYVPQKIETRGGKTPHLHLFSGMVLARQNGMVLARQKNKMRNSGHFKEFSVKFGQGLV